MAIVALIPGVGFVEETMTGEQLVPGAGFVNETYVAGATFQPAWALQSNIVLVGTNQS